MGREARVPHSQRRQPSALSLIVGLAALVAPALHTASDLVEWYQDGFSSPQLWLNYAAFLPMPWLLVGIVAVHVPRPALTALLGAILYGYAFVYFAHTTLYALSEQVQSYAALWERLGAAYTVHGALMACGGLLFAWPVLRAGWLPRFATVLFLSGILMNLALWILPAPEILQTLGSAVRNAGLIAMGYAIVFPRNRAPT